MIATPETITISPAQVMLDHAVEWIAKHNVADKVLSITTIGRPRLHLDNIALLRQCLRGTGAELIFSDGGKRARATFDGIDFVALDDPPATADSWSETI